MTPVLAQQAAAATSSGGVAEIWVFVIVGAVSVGSAIAMLLLRNPVHSALMLVLNFFTIAVFYAVLEAQFLAVVQIIVYAGAIMVLFLFVLMLLGVSQAQAWSARIRGQVPISLFLGVVLLAALSAGVAGPWMGAGSVCGAEAAATATATGAGAQSGEPCAGLAAANADGNVRGVGMLLFTDYVWPFEVTSVLLVVAALGAMVLGKREEDPDDLVDEPERVPARAGAGSTAAADTAGGGA